MKALVTGSAGFIGTHVSKALLGDGFEVTGYDQKESRGDRRRIGRRGLSRSRGVDRSRPGSRRHRSYRRHRRRIPRRHQPGVGSVGKRDREHQHRPRRRDGRGTGGVRVDVGGLWRAGLRAGRREASLRAGPSVQHHQACRRAHAHCGRPASRRAGGRTSVGHRIWPRDATELGIRDLHRQSPQGRADHHPG